MEKCYFDKSDGISLLLTIASANMSWLLSSNFLSYFFTLQAIRLNKDLTLHTLERILYLTHEILILLCVKSWNPIYVH
ncbi:hypothetical protein Ahy_A07g032872 isoform B [Arachis hypogaea]|uniref:Uncharacterized protein n=1 Tax=Arachis hypogaea TaxID=3818 RepID=A0A445C7Q1_ARAHY|nr:hypothetical protein Ahy_A07g032872 isoform B [Arachis hypogaea]